MMIVFSFVGSYEITGGYDPLEADYFLQCSTIIQ